MDSAGFVGNGFRQTVLKLLVIYFFRLNGVQVAPVRSTGCKVAKLVPSLQLIKCLTSYGTIGYASVAKVQHQERFMEIREIVAYALGTVLVASLILRYSNYEGEKSEDVEFK